MNRLLIFLAVVLSIISCNNSGERVQRHRSPSLLIPTSSGNPYEVMVVAEDSIWNGIAGINLSTVLTTPLPMLPQEEPMFHVSHITNEHYDRITNLFRNIVLLQVNPYTTQPHISLQHDLFSSPQLVMTIEGPSQDELAEFISNKTQLIINYFTDEEINRTAAIIDDEHNPKFFKAVKEMFGCELSIPTDLNKIKIGDNFIWASNDGVSNIQNVCIYSFPYVSQKIFTRGAYIALRDTFMKRNIQGIKDGQYMSTNDEFVQVKNMQVRGRYVQEARGLWEMTNDMMGGPFISHSQVDTVNNMVIVVEGFVYAPDKMKRTMLRRLEAALYTLKLPTEKNNKNEKN